jgi:hypothetical protein
MKPPESDPISTPKRICVRPGCTVELSAANTSGRCRAHVRWRDRPSSGDGGAIEVTAPANGVKKTGDGVGKGANGHAIGHDLDASTPKNGSNGAAAVAGDFLEERLNVLLLNLPAVDKSRIAEKWLRGEL